MGGPAAGITITVNQPSTAPTSLTASPNIICNGQNYAHANRWQPGNREPPWKWYSNNTYTTLVVRAPATASLTVSPATTTTHYPRIEGGSAPCTATINGPAAGVTITVSQPSIAPRNIAGIGRNDLQWIQYHVDPNRRKSWLRGNLEMVFRQYIQHAGWYGHRCFSQPGG